MQKLVAWVQGALVPALGPFGLFVVAFLDSSFLSLPEINDLLVVTAALQDAPRAWTAVAMATLGSLAGCSVLYTLGRRGEEAILVKRFGEERTRRVRAAFQRYDVLTLAIPAVLPPPMPFKIFVLAAGVFEFSYRRFALTLLVARGLRYTLWASLGLAYREEALSFLKAVDAWGSRNAPWLVGLVLGLATVALLVLWRRRARGAAASDEPAAG
jgi:membrane protein YqaA with SNARE-associated domain